MKRCPRCNETYGEALQFCSQDGTPLDASARYDTQPATLALSLEPATQRPHDISPAKYIFLDVVGFTHNRSVEAQSDIVNALNGIVRDSVSAHDIPKDRIIYIPTGDGICVALLNVESPFDIHMRIALSILDRIKKHNDATENEMRKFQVRIGVNSNTDNLVTDINSQPNVAGAGISMAARVMDKADGGQILVGRSVYDMLRYREKYASAFKAYRATVKHGMMLDVYQFVAEGFDGLNTDTPQAFKDAESPKPEPEPKLSLRVACYFAHAIKNRAFFLERKGGAVSIRITLLWLLAGDTEAEIEAMGLSSHPRHTQPRDGSFEEQFEYYSKLEESEYSLLSEFSELITFSRLFKYKQYFDNYYFWLINTEGKDKLKRDWPDIWEKFDLDNL
jgi:class 3 adenylate cyclase